MCDFNYIKTILPPDTVYRILGYKNIDTRYAWVKIKGVDTLKSSAGYKATTDVKGLSFVAPSGTRLTRFVTLPKGFFIPKELSEKELLMSLYLLFGPNGFRSKLRHEEGREYRSATLRRVLGNDKDPYDLVCIKDEYNFRIRDLIFDEELFLDLYKNEPTFEWYHMYRLLSAGYNIPKFFAGAYRLENSHTKVPLNLYWMFQLKYGRLNNIYSMNGNVEVSADRTIKVYDRYLKSKLVQIDMGRTYDPVLIQNSMAIRHVRKR